VAKVLFFRNFSVFGCSFFSQKRYKN
jgi:hypothetical protein